MKARRGSRLAAAGGRVGVLHAALALCVLLAPCAAGQTVQEDRLKAEFVERFTRFIDWPEESLPAAEGPFVIGVVGETPFAADLQEMARTRKIKGRRVAVRTIGAAEIERCQVVWVPERAGDQLERILARARGKAVLTVADTPGFAEAGVLINLKRSDRRLRFEINVDEAEKSPLGFRAKLLRLGMRVGAGSKP